MAELKILTTSLTQVLTDRTVTLSDIEELQPRLFEALLDACCLRDKMQKLHVDINAIKVQENRMVKISLCETRYLLQPHLKRLLLDFGEMIHAEQRIETDLEIIADSVKNYFRKDELDEDSDQDTEMADNSTKSAKHIRNDDDHVHSMKREGTPQTKTTSTTFAVTVKGAEAGNLSNEPLPALENRVNEMNKTEANARFVALTGAENFDNGPILLLNKRENEMKETGTIGRIATRTDDKWEQNYRSDGCYGGISMTEQEVQDPCCNISHLRLAATSSKCRAATFACEKCDKCFPSIRQLRQHCKIHKVPEFTCSICSRVFKYAKSLEEHMNIHTGINPFKCKLCHQQFPTSMAVYNHKRRNHSQRYQGTTCKICGMRFKYEGTRNTHYYKHTEKELAEHDIVLDNTQCHKCGKVFRNSYLSIHMSLKHGDQIHGEQPKVPVICEICGRELKNEATLKRHVWRHKREQMSCKVTTEDGHEPSKDSTYVCDLCHKAFSTQQNLKIHNFIHSLQLQKTYGPYYCHLCGKKWSSKPNLKVHMNSHFNSKPFACDSCDLTFSSPSNLNRHVLVIHKGKKNFKCSYCDRSFGQKTTRDDHHNTHTGARPYQCDTCGQKFSDRGTTRKHKARHDKKGF